MKYMRIALTGAYRYGFANGLVDPVLRPRVLEMNTTPKRRPADAAGWEANEEREVMRIKVRRGSDAADKAVRRRREQVPHAADEEFVAVLNATRSARDRCLLAWLRAPGLRVGQAVTLKRDRVHLGAFQECVSARLGGHVHVEPVTDHPQQAGVKVADPIALPLGSFGVDAYREWLGERAGIREARLSPWLFVTLPGGPVPAGQALSTQGVRSMLAEACKRAGVRILRPHMLRHSAGQTGADLNLAPDLLQRILGHRSITSQGVYRRVSDTRAEAAVQSLESFRSRVEQHA